MHLHLARQVSGQLLVIGGFDQISLQLGGTFHEDLQRHFGGLAAFASARRQFHLYITLIICIANSYVLSKKTF